jgi:hypothetical protein
MTRRMLGALVTVLVASAGAALSCTEVLDKNCQYTGTCPEASGAGGLSSGGTQNGGGAGEGGASACAEPFAGTTPLCDSASGECVQCTATEGCPDGHCDGGRCVECLETPHCTSPSAPLTEL